MLAAGAALVLGPAQERADDGASRNDDPEGSGEREGRSAPASCCMKPRRLYAQAIPTTAPVSMKRMRYIARSSLAVIRLPLTWALMSFPASVTLVR